MGDENEQRDDERDEGDPRERPLRDNLVRATPEIELRAVEEGQEDGRIGTLVGRLAEYGTWALVESKVEGRFMERVLPGGFADLVTNRSRTQVLFDHGLDQVIGRKPLGPLEEIVDDGRSASYQAALLDTDYNRSLLPALRAKLLGSSWRMSKVRDSWRQRPSPSEHNPEGLPERTIRGMLVVELGPTPFPVYSGTVAGVRSATDDYFAELLGDRSAPPPNGLVVDQPGGGRQGTEFSPVTTDDFIRILNGG